ncbi:MAG: LysR family transcriptional regulator [Betaproteobacteria bacterium]|nr:MAG: LysR family transcriptional regulator [Betaproteobacteria bacterium]
MDCMVCIIAMNVHDVDLNLLRVFDAVLYERGVTPAATRLGLTQPAVSNALARLRAVFGDALFVRTAAGMDPTPFARELAEPVRQALALLESALAHGPGFDPASSTRAFRFYMSDLGQVEFLPPIVERVQSAAPGVRLEAAAADLEHIGDALGGGALDLAVGFLPGLGAPIKRRVLFRDPYVCLMRAGHPALAGRLTRRKFLDASHVLVTYRGGGHRVIEEALERAGIARRIALRVPHFTVVPMVLERTNLILTLPARVARVYERRGSFRALPAPVPIPPAEVAVHWHERFESDPGNRWFREQIVELFSEK